MYKKEVVGMLLAGGQGSRLGVLTKNIAKPAVPFSGKYRIIDFTLSNCINSGIDTVGVLTQYQPLKLNQHIGIGIPWDLDRKIGGVTLLSPHMKGTTGDWYQGTADAVFHNVNYIDEYNPDYVLILSGDHIYKMDYSEMIEAHKKNNADVTIGVLEVPIEEASRYGIMNTSEDNETIVEFEEKPEQPKSNLASMGIYVFSWKVLKKALIEGNKEYENCDFGKHIIPKLLETNKVMKAFRFRDYWRDVGTIESFWKANMEMIDIIPEFNLYEEHWKIYTDSGEQMPVYFGENGKVDTSIVSGGSEVDGEIKKSIIGHNVIIDKGAKISDSIIMGNVHISSDVVINKSIICEDCVIESGVKIGEGEDIVNEDFPKIYNAGITVIGEKTILPQNVVIGKNCVILGSTEISDYSNGRLESGKSLIKEEVKK